MSNVRRATDWLLDEGSGYLKTSRLYENQLDRAADAVFDALERRPGDPDLTAIAHALTN
jgi:hypothetical protein